ncbi:Hypothetical protein CINCED_3A015874 [Cinara cedri]|nr:Hypothetical protein CINCED_3A015874 [Cinara cedri]
MIAMYFRFNIFHILPYMYPKPLSVWCLVTHILPFTFVVFNMLSNFCAIICTDSSIFDRLLPISTCIENYIGFCDICLCDIPPRCSHCDVCNVCILTRDHHCPFSMTCVGHYNRRYFLWFLLYMSAACFYEIVLISYYMYNEVTIQMTDLIVLFWPIPKIITFYLNTAQTCIVLLIFSIIGVIYSSLLFIFHLNKVCKGLVCREKQEKNYDFGLVKNLESVFGEKWYITWISPFIKSKLPYDGFNWPLPMFLYNH